MEKKELISNEAIALFNSEHLQEIKALCELLEYSLLDGLNKGLYKDILEDVTVWEMTDDFTRHALGMMEAFIGAQRFTANEMLILEGIIHDRACEYLQKRGIVLD